MLLVKIWVRAETTYSGQNIEFTIPYFFYTGGTVFRPIFTDLKIYNLGLIPTYSVHNLIQCVLFHSYAA